MRKTLLRTLVRDLPAVALLVAAGIGAGDHAADRRHHHHRRRRLHADDAAEARKRADQAVRPREVQDHRRHPPLAAAPLVLEFDKHGAVETRGLQKCTMAKLVATTTKLARKLCPGAIVGTGFGTARGRAARTAADQGLLAADPLQRPGQARQPDRPRPRPHRLSRADHLRDPDRDPEDPPRPLRVQDRRQLPADRQRLRLADLRPPDDRPRMDVQGQDGSATPTPTAPTAASRPRPNSASRTATPSRARSSSPARCGSSRRGTGATLADAGCLGGDEAKPPLTIGALLVACASVCSAARPARRRSGSGRWSCAPTGASSRSVLPKRAYAPINFQGHGEIETTDGSVPPALQHVEARIRPRRAG